MDITRNQWFLGGLVLVMLGLQFRMVESFVLTPECTKILAKQTGHPVAAVDNSMATLVGTPALPASKTVHPPEWLGWALLSIGAVMILQSLAMPPPG